MGLKKYFSKFLPKKTKKRSKKSSEFSETISEIIGHKIQNIHLYKEAFSVKTASKNDENYERLEFLGDAVLGTIISYYLYDKYPNANEGFLTQMKAKIVNRKNLNKIGNELNITQFIQNDKCAMLSKNISGNLLEALIGAIFLDTGYENCKDIVLKRIVPAEEIIKLENKIGSYKGVLLEWSQKRKLELKYETSEIFQINKEISFRSFVLIDEKKIANATDSSKKRAEEKAAKRAFYTLNKKEHILEEHYTISG